ncbi:MAG: S1C family serine protease [Akkermansiaceae bacterium]|nr:S1C family serine protease [Akkermansiaceae bacterium]
MKLLLILLLFLVPSFVQAGGLPWIGVSLKPLTTEDREVSPLGPGVGLRVSGVVANGPLAKAGGKDGDLWWKFDDQILLNMRQMVVLLREKKVGETVEVQIFRKGDLKKFNLLLGSRQVPQVRPVSSLIKNRNIEKSRRLAKREQVARLSTEEQVLSLESEGKRWRFKVKEDDVVILSALVSADDLSEKLPRKWIGAFMILRQTLQRRLDAGDASSEEKVRFTPRVTK